MNSQRPDSSMLDRRKKNIPSATIHMRSSTLLISLLLLSSTTIEALVSRSLLKPSRSVFCLIGTEQLEKLGVLDSVSEDDDSTLSGLSGTATETSTREYKEAESCHSITEDDRSELGGNDTPTSDSRRHSAPLTALQPQSEIPQGIVESPLRRSIQETPKNFYRLSVPPSLRLAPPASHLAASPKKTTPNGSLASLIEVPRLVGEWAQRTPSPIKSIRSGIQSPTPSETRKRGNSMAALRNVVASALRRRVVTNPDSPSGSSSRNTS